MTYSAANGAWPAGYGRAAGGAGQGGMADGAGTGASAGANGGGVGGGAKKKSRPRILAFDLVRLLIMAFVVSVHLLSVVGGNLTVPMGAFVTVFHTSRELFFLLTAFVLTYNYAHRPRIRWLKFWRRRYSLVVPAYIVWSLIYYVADHRKLDPLSAAAHGIYKALITANSRYQMYFLLVTMQVYLTFPALRWLLHKTRGHHLVVFIAAALYQLVFSYAVQHNLVKTGLLGSYMHTRALWLPSYPLYLIAGALAAWHFNRVNNFTRRHASWLNVVLVTTTGVAAGVGVYLVEVYAGGQSTLEASAVFQPVVVFETMAFGWALLAAGYLWSDRGAPGRKLIAIASDGSFGIYLAHPLVIQGLLLAATKAGVLHSIRHAPSAIEIAVLLGLWLPLVYYVAGVMAYIARRTPLSLVLTGREMARTPRGRHAKAREPLIANALRSGISAIPLKGAAGGLPRSAAAKHQLRRIDA